MNSNGVDLYLLAGVKTWPTYFREPAERLKAMSIEAGYAIANVHVLYPYGDHTIPLLRQVREVARDVMRRLALAADDLRLSHPAPDQSGARAAGSGRSPSGAPSPQQDAAGRPLPVDTPAAAAPPSLAPAPSVDAPSSFASTPSAETSPSLAPAPPEPLAEAIRERSAGRVVVLIGHSGGGVAAYHAGRHLLAEGAVRDCRIVQIGSPKVRVHPALRDRTAFFYAADDRGRLRDPITRLGTWGGIRRAAAGIPVWDPRRWAPGHVAAIAIDGGHKDYFACRPSGAAGRPTNLERTAGAVLDWLVRSLRPEQGLSPARQVSETVRSSPDYGQPSPVQ